ncbi:hypothetical protein Hsero_3754 [Herbaspirillum seropedicae SmR1]|uniref:Uncharacterized protein n=1 Tax=Herbaspirillum seropedicae (strain SmR1) TaxID=757424 RepID=D8IRA6_HERSS|nr:hypothetical protein Hsero_3754 [Herbaspirillum seropedicae SmR1]
MPGAVGGRWSRWRCRNCSSAACRCVGGKTGFCSSCARSFSRNSLKTSISSSAVRLSSLSNCLRRLACICTCMSAACSCPSGRAASTLCCRC